MLTFAVDDIDGEFWVMHGDSEISSSAGRAPSEAKAAETVIFWLSRWLPNKRGTCGCFGHIDRAQMTFAQPWFCSSFMKMEDGRPKSITDLG